MGHLPFITVILPTYNRLDLLQKTITSLRAQTYPFDRFEVIVVDDGSTDGTAVYLTNQPDLHVIHQANGGPAAARNAGVLAAQGDLLAFIDDDCQAAPGWLYALAKSIQDSTILDLGAVGGPVLPVRHTHWLHQFYLFANRIHPQGQPSGSADVLFSCNMAISPPILAEVGGFDTSFSHPGGEDLDLSYRLQQAGYTLWLNNEAAIYHQYPLSWRGVTAHFWQHGLGMARVFHKWPHLIAHKHSYKWRGRLQKMVGIKQLLSWSRPLLNQATSRAISQAVWQAVMCLGHSFVFSRRLMVLLRQKWNQSYSPRRLLLYTFLSYYTFLAEQLGLIYGVYTYFRHEQIV